MWLDVVSLFHCDNVIVRRNHCSVSTNVWKNAILCDRRHISEDDANALNMYWNIHWTGRTHGRDVLEDTVYDNRTIVEEMYNYRRSWACNVHNNYIAVPRTVCPSPTLTCVEFYIPHNAHSTVQTRGVCVCHEKQLIWHDLWKQWTHSMTCHFLHRMPSQLDTSLVHHQTSQLQTAPQVHPPNPHSHQVRNILQHIAPIPSNVLVVVGTPEDTMCQTNYRQFYRVQNKHKSVGRNLCREPFPSPHPSHSMNYHITELLLGGAFESYVTQLRLMHFRTPYMIITGYPVAAAPCRSWNHFGVWNIKTKTPTLSSCNHPHSVPQPIMTALSPWCATSATHGWWRFEQMCVDDDRGHTIYWTYRKAFACVHLPTKTTKCISNYPALNGVDVGTISVSRMWGVVGVYDKSEHVWRVHDLETGTKMLHTFDDSRFQLTRLTFLPHLGMCLFTRCMSGTVVVQRVHMGSCLGWNASK